MQFMLADFNSPLVNLTVVYPLFNHILTTAFQSSPWTYHWRPSFLYLKFWLQLRAFTGRNFGTFGTCTK